PVAHRARRDAVADPQEAARRVQLPEEPRPLLRRAGGVLAGEREVPAGRRQRLRRAPGPRQGGGPETRLRPRPRRRPPRPRPPRPRAPAARARRARPAPAPPRPPPPPPPAPPRPPPPQRKGTTHRALAEKKRGLLRRPGRRRLSCRPFPPATPSPSHLLVAN